MSHPDATMLAAMVDGQLSDEEHRAMEAHLTQCLPCRSQHARLTAAANALRQLAAPVLARSSLSMADALFRREQRLARWAWSLAGACALLLAVVVAMTGGFDWGHRSAAWVARGGGSLRPLRLEVFAEDGLKGRRVLHSGSVVGAETRLGFNLEKRTGGEFHLALLGVDSAGAIHWFYPAYLSDEADPEAIALPAGRARFELPELVQPSEPAPGSFLIVALLAPEALGVRKVEALLASGGVEQLNKLGSVETATLSVTVEP